MVLLSVIKRGKCLMETVLCVELLTILKLWIVDAKFITEKRIPFLDNFRLEPGRNLLST